MALSAGGERSAKGLVSRVSSLVADSPDWTSSRPPATPPALARTAARVFSERFGVIPRWVVAAPGRVNLIGEHTDYNGGFVLPLAIDRHVVIAGAPAPAGETRLRAYSAALDRSVDIRPDGSDVPGEPTWANYLRGIVSGFCQRGVAPPGLDLVILSDLPIGGGLSSSAALEVATATLLEAATGTRLDPWDKARICQKAEHDFAGVPCGLMDQVACVLGDEAGALLIDCANETVRLVPFADPGVEVVICNSNVRHALADGFYARRRRECAEAAGLLGVASLREATPEMVETSGKIADPAVLRRARHVTTENLRTIAAADHLEASRFQKVGALMYESHRSLRDDFEVSSPELDVLVDIAREIGEAGGVLGARMTGGGFGGCIVALVRSEHVEAMARRLARDYTARTGITGATFISRPARGAALIHAAAVG
jgi:galactokinase